MANKAKTAKKVTIPSSNKFSKTIIEQKEESDEEVEQDQKEEDQDMEIVDDKEDEEGNISKDKSSDDDSLLKSNGALVFDDEGNEVNFDEKNNNDSNDVPKQEFIKANKGKGKKELTPEEKQKRNENLKKLREKLSDKISTLKEKRKAPGTKHGGSIKSRDQILADRKRKEELRKAEKLKRKHDEVEPESDSDGDSDDEQKIDDKSQQKEEKDNILFGNIVFNDGTRVTSDLNRMRSTVDKKKLKGPANKDIKAHLLKLEQKKLKLAQLSPEDQLKQQEKEKWQRVTAQAEGVKIKDDEKLLKKALKRKDKQKLRSEIEWKDRKQVVKDTVAARSKRREENLKARKDNKGKKGKKNQQPKLRKFTGVVNKKAAKAGKKRAGFEGSAKSKGKGGARGEKK